MASSVLQRVHVEGAADDEPQHIRIDRLLIEVIGAERHGLQCALAIGVAGHDDDLGLRRDAQDLGQRRQAFGDAFRVRRQAQILEHDRRLETAQSGQRLAARRHQQGLVVVETPLELALQPQVVLDDEQFVLLLTHRLAPA
jgi:hypothetical protein